MEEGRSGGSDGESGELFRDGFCGAAGPDRRGVVATEHGVGTGRVSVQTACVVLHHGGGVEVPACEGEGKPCGFLLYPVRLFRCSAAVLVERFVLDHEGHETTPPISQ